MALTLVILAAGKGTRFGGDKAMAPVGPAGQSLFEYSVYDAIKAGFEHIIFVVSEQRDTAEFSSRLQQYGNALRVEFIVQYSNGTLDNNNNEHHEPSRSKPWGTAQAVLVCKQHIDNPFLVINADDHFGPQGFESIGQYLTGHYQNPKACALVGYRLRNTLSRSGGVNRGVCSVGEDGYLESVREVRNIAIDESQTLQHDDSDVDEPVTLDSLVSMTFWGFQPAVFSVFENGFEAFLNNANDLVDNEYTIPEVVDLAIRNGEATFKILHSAEKWQGITYATDLAAVQLRFQQLTDAGIYPYKLA